MRRLCPDLAFPTGPYLPGRGPHPRHDPGHGGTHVADLSPTRSVHYGIDLLHAGFDWEAHEVWEGVWRSLPRSAPRARLLQALIGLAAVGLKRSLGRPPGRAAGAVDVLSGLAGLDAAWGVDVRRTAAAFQSGERAVYMVDAVYKILPAAAWRGRDSHVPWAPVDAADGFLHLSAPHQLRGTAHKHFATQTDLVLLRLDPARIPELRWEPSRGGDLFPHAYAPVPVDAVVGVSPLVGATPGEFAFPDEGLPALDVDAIRAQYPALSRVVGARPAVFLDGPAGSQVPRSVAEAASHYLLHVNANTHGPFVTSNESDAMVADVASFVADFLQVDDPDEIAFGANMTTLTLGLSRALGATWGPDDEIVVSRLDHDANVTPWVRAASDAGATVRWIELHPTDGTLDLDSLDAVLSERTRLVAVGAASNALGTVNPVAEVCRRAHAAGAEVFVDAVHYAPHRRMHVPAWDCDYLVCSAYKFFGPHVGLLWGRRARMEALPAYRVRPAGEAIPGKWMTGTQNLEGIAGTGAALAYLASLGGPAPTRREGLDRGFAAILDHETRLCHALLDAFAAVPEVRVWGIDDPARVSERVATFGVTVDGVASTEVARRLGERGIFVWPGDFYAVECIRALGLEPEGVVRIGALHYNTVDEVGRVGRALADIAAVG